MGDETQLPIKCRLYLKVIDELLDFADGLDSVTNEAKMFNKEIEYYLALIRVEIDMVERE